MPHDRVKKLLQTMDSLRQLSFRVSEESLRMESHKKRVAALKKEVSKTKTLKSAYKKKSKQLSNKISKIKTISKS